ncbi:MAG: hypothetical protein LUD02_11480 [Tannerellaceae bacterium]|nr:hypothetical protein [Tannerellaceae bacterium]
MMKTFTLRQTILAVTTLLMSLSIFAQEAPKFEITPEADLVSSYVWRGVHQSGPSIQPSLTASYGGLSLNLWGSTDFSTANDMGIAKEFDITLAYEVGGLTLAVTDYWWAGEGARYGNYSANHYYEGSIGYYFGDQCPLSLSWSTMFGPGTDEKKENGDPFYSTFIEAAYDFNVLGVDVTPSIGVSPWTGMYHREGTSGFALSTIAVKASKEIKITDSFSLPIFAEAIVAPNQDTVFLVFGLTIK